MERVLEVWSACAVCGLDVRLLDTTWHHEAPADHAVVLVIDAVLVKS